MTSEADTIRATIAHLQLRLREIERLTGPLPEGDYEALIDSVERRPTLSGKSHYWSIRYKVLSGAYRGRHVWQSVVERISPVEDLARKLGVDVRVQDVTWQGASPEDFLDIECLISVRRRDAWNGADGASSYNEVWSVRLP